MKTYLEYRDEKSSKFWEVTVTDTTMTTRWGAIGGEGQSKEKLFGSRSEATTEAERVAAQKVRKGYAPLEGYPPAATESPSGRPKVVKVSSDDSLRVLSPQFWPLIFGDREYIEVTDVPMKAIQGDVVFTDNDEEYSEIINKPNYRYEGFRGKDGESLSKEISGEIEGLKGNKKRYKLSRLFRANDQVIARTFNDFLSENPTRFETNAEYNSHVTPYDYKYILFRCRLNVIPGMLKRAKKSPDMVCKVLLPVSDAKIAPLMASRLLMTPVTRAVKKWFLRNAEVAIYGLLPIAVGKVFKERNHCEAALRFLASNGYEEKILLLSKGYDQEVTRAVEEILSVDLSIDYHPNKLPEIPSWLLKAETTMPLEGGTGAYLTTDTLQALFGMMSLSSFDDVYPPLQKILPLLDRNVLSEFSWEIFQVWDKLPSWNDRDKKMKKDAEWVYHCLGYMGSDQTVKKLIPLINSWPKDGGMNKAVAGLDILANIGSDFAIRSINKILLKTKYKPLLERAGDIMGKVADVRGLTKAELDDRLVPTFGLGASDSFVLDFGSRSFTIKINEKLVPAVFDQDNKKIKDLPKPVKADEKSKAKEVTAFWKDLKAGMKTEASTQLLRFEQAMLTGRQWGIADFRSLLVTHPILCTLVRHLVWGAVKDGKVSQLFRINDEGRCLDAKGKEVTLSDAVVVSLPHPLQIQKSLELWKDALAKNKLKQPFAQISRKTYLKKEDKNKDLFGINGATAPAKAFRGLKAKGWRTEMEGINSLIGGYSKQYSLGIVELRIDGKLFLQGGGALNDEELKIDVTLLKKLTDIEYSEVVRDLKELLH